MLRDRFIALLGCLIISAESLACSFAPMTEAFVVVEGEGMPPAKPDFIVKEIKRGHDDGNPGSCSDAGILILKRETPPENSTGYLFGITAGEFEADIFDASPIKAVERNEKEGLYNFVWLDGASDWQEPIDITVKIVTVSKTGQKSEPQMLKVMHPGSKRPWWRVW